MAVSGKKFLLLSAFLAAPVFGWWFFGMEWGDGSDDIPAGPAMLEAGRDYRITNDGATISDMPDSDMLETFEPLKTGFKDIAISLAGDAALAQETVRKETIVKDENSTVESTYGLDGVTVRTEYKKRKDDPKVKTLDEGGEKVKQTIFLKNHTGEDKKVTFTTTTKISSDTVVWNGQEYKLTHKPQRFNAEKKTVSIPEFANGLGNKDLSGVDAFKRYTHTYFVGTSLSFKVEEGKEAIFDWSDAVHLNCDVRAYERDGEFFFDFTVRNFGIPANSESVIDPNYALSDSGNYDARFDGSLNVGGTADVGEQIGGGDLRS